MGEDLYTTGSTEAHSVWMMVMEAAPLEPLAQLAGGSIEEIPLPQQL